MQETQLKLLEQKGNFIGIQCQSQKEQRLSLSLKRRQDFLPSLVLLLSAYQTHSVASISPEAAAGPLSSVLTS